MQHTSDNSPRAPTTSPPVGSSTSTSSNQSCSSQTNYQQQQNQMSQNNQQHLVQRKCQAQSEEINSWNVDQVCDFIGTIDICVEYVQVCVYQFIIIHSTTVIIRFFLIWKCY
jgi:hypothetical protein